MLKILLFLPLISALILSFSRFSLEKDPQGKLRSSVYLITQFLIFAVSIITVAGYLLTPGSVLDDAVYSRSLIPELGINFSLYLSPVNSWFLFLQAIIFLIVAIAGRSLKIFDRGFLLGLNILQAAIIGTLAANNLLLFYVFWELMLIPIYFMMGIWGGEKRLAATVRFVIYTIAGSILMFAGIIYLGFKNYEIYGNMVSAFDWENLVSLSRRLSYTEQWYLFWAFALAFLVKIPAFPFHSWLPLAYRESSFPMAIILSAVVGKLGLYGFLRFVIPLFTSAFTEAAPLLGILALLGILYGAALACVQKDLRGLLAYSSFSHISFCLLALAGGAVFVRNIAGVKYIDIQASSAVMLQVVSHGFIVAGLFILASYLQQFKSRPVLLSDFGGLAAKDKLLALIFALFSFAAVGLPLTSGFVGEFSCLLQAFNGLPLLASIALVAIVLSAIYMFSAYLKIFFGPENSLNDSEMSLSYNNQSNDLTSSLSFLLILIFILGIYPLIIFESFSNYLIKLFVN